MEASYEESLTEVIGSKREVSGYRAIIRRAKFRSKAKNFAPVDLTIPYLHTLWSSQEGKCIYTGICLQLPTYYGSHDPITTASLDRIDSSKGYIVGNVQFVSTAVNYMKGVMTHAQTLDLVDLIRDPHL